MGSGGGCRDCKDRHPILSSLPIVGKIFRNDTGETSRRISRQESYDASTAQLEQTIRIQEELTTFRLKCERESDELEKGALKESRKNLDDMMDFLKSINEKSYAGQKLKINLERLQKDNRQTEDIINGYIKKRIQKRVSLDDDECLRILKMDVGSDKEKEMTNFLNKILQESMSGLIKEINKSLKKQLENVEDQINARIDSYTELSEEKMKAYQELERIKTSDEHELEEKIIGLEYKCALSDLGLDILE